MPELPEVEANMRNLTAWSVGRRIVEVIPPKGTRELAGLAPEEFARRIRGRRIEGVARKGKWILIKLSSNGGLGLHLGMTGKLGRVDSGQEPPRFTRAVFVLGDRTRICFVDQRRFGRLIARKSFAELIAIPEIQELGPDALALTRDLLESILARTGRTVKETLMDQRATSGLGNLYTTEALWRARIHPAMPARAVAQEATLVKRLLLGIQNSLHAGLLHFERMTLPVYVEEGGANPFKVYDRTGEPCPRCGERLVTMTLGGRTTTYCASCQPP